MSDDFDLTETLNFTLLPSREYDLNGEYEDILNVKVLFAHKEAVQHQFRL